MSEQIPSLINNLAQAAAVPPSGASAPAGTLSLAPAVEQPAVGPTPVPPLNPGTQPAFSTPAVPQPPQTPMANVAPTAPSAPAQQAAAAPTPSVAEAHRQAQLQAQQIIDAQAQQLSTPQPAAQPAQQVVAPAPATTSAMRAALEAEGFEVPADLTTDQAVIKHLAQQIDQSNATPQAPGMEAASPQPGETSGVPSATPAATNPLHYEVSAEAKQLAEAGLLTRTEQGWQATIPGIDQRYVSEMNTQEAIQVSNAKRITTQPLEFLKDAASELGLVDSDAVKALRTEIDELKTLRQTEQALKENDRVDQWVEANKPHLFINGDPNAGWSPYGNKYLETESMVRGWFPEKLSRGELNKRVLEVMNTSGITPQTYGVQQGAAIQQPVAPVAPQPVAPFVATIPAQPQGVVNTLPDYASAAPAAEAPMRLGKAGYPSLFEHIAANPSHLQ